MSKTIFFYREKRTFMGKKILWYLSVFILTPSFLMGRNLQPYQRIIGTDDFERVVLSQDNIDIVQSIGMMKLGCTVTHIGNGFAVTAGHCFYHKPSDKVIKDKSCSKGKYIIEWGKTYQGSRSFVSNCKRIVVLEHSSSVDYALIQVFPVPNTYLEIENLDNIVEREEIKLISYPKKRPMEWSGICLAELYSFSTYAQRWVYECDTEPGSSGAPLLNAQNKIVGIHNSYISTLNKNSGTHIANTNIIDYLKF